MNKNQKQGFSSLKRIMPLQQMTISECHPPDSVQLENDVHVFSFFSFVLGLAFFILGCFFSVNPFIFLFMEHPSAVTENLRIIIVVTGALIWIIYTRIYNIKRNRFVLIWAFITFFIGVMSPLNLILNVLALLPCYIWTVDLSSHGILFWIILIVYVVIILSSCIIAFGMTLLLAEHSSINLFWRSADNENT